MGSKQFSYDEDEKWKLNDEILNLNIIPLLIVSSCRDINKPNYGRLDIHNIIVIGDFSCLPCPLVIIQHVCERSRLNVVAQQWAPPKILSFYRKDKQNSEYSPASEERWLIPLFISCFPMFEVCGDCDAVKLLCDTNWDDFFLLLLADDDGAEVDCFLWLFCNSGCCADCGDGRLDCCCSVAMLRFLRNLVRKPLSGGYAGYYRPLIRTHPRLFSLLLYQTPVNEKMKESMIIIVV